MSHLRENIVTEYYVKRIRDPDGDPERDRILTSISFLVLPGTYDRPTMATFVLPFVDKVVPSNRRVAVDAFHLLENLARRYCPSEHSVVSRLKNSLYSLWQTPPKISSIPRAIIDTFGWWESSTWASFRACEWQFHETASEVATSTLLRISPERKRLLCSAYDHDCQVVTCTVNLESSTEPYRLPPFTIVTTGCAKARKLVPFLPGLQYPETNDHLADWNTVVYAEGFDDAILKTHTGKPVKCSKVQVPPEPSLVAKSGPSEPISVYRVSGYHPNADLVISHC